MLSGADWRGVEELHICLVLPVIFSRLFICMVDVTIFGFNLSFVQLQVVPCFSSGPTGKVWGPTSRSELPCYDSQPTVLYCCHCHCQGTGARYTLTTAPGSFRCLGWISSTPGLQIDIGHDPNCPVGMLQWFWIHAIVPYMIRKMYYWN